MDGSTKLRRETEAETKGDVRREMGSPLKLVRSMEITYLLNLTDPRSAAVTGDQSSSSAHFCQTLSVRHPRSPAAGGQTLTADGNTAHRGTREHSGEHRLLRVLSSQYVAGTRNQDVMERLLLPSTTSANEKAEKLD